nr:hypothetical protein [uncultured Roseateles sp.]
MTEQSTSTLGGALRRLRARWARPQTLWLQPDGVCELQPGGASAVQPWTSWCQAHAGAAAQVWVSGALLHHLVGEAGMPLEDDAALNAYASQLLGHYFGAAAQRWALAPWRSGERSGACALQGADLAQLRAAALAHAIDLRSLRPAWSVALAALQASEPEWARAPQAALAFVEGQLVTWVGLQQGRCVALRHARLTEATMESLGEALTHLRAEQGQGAAVETLVLGCGLAAAPSPVLPVWPGVRLLGRLDGDAPTLAQLSPPAKPAGANLPQPDFVATGPRSSPLGWALAATGLLVLVTAAWTASESHAARETARQELAQLQNRARGRPAALTAVAAPVARNSSAQASSQQQAQLEATRAAREVAGLLQEPWGQILSQVETAGGKQVQWLGFDYTAVRAELRLEGLSADRKTALDVVDRLSALPGWQDVVLSRLMTGDQGLAGLRLDVSAKLLPQRLTAEARP